MSWKYTHANQREYSVTLDQPASTRWLGLLDQASDLIKIRASLAAACQAQNQRGQDLNELENKISWATLDVSKFFEIFEYFDFFRTGSNLANIFTSQSRMLKIL